MLRNHKSACFRVGKAGFRMAGVWLVLLLATSATAFYLPGLAPVTYCTTKVKTEFDTLLFYKNIKCFIEVFNIFCSNVFLFIFRSQLHVPMT